MSEVSIRDYLQSRIQEFVSEKLTDDERLLNMITHELENVADDTDASLDQDSGFGLSVSDEFKVEAFTEEGGFYLRVQSGDVTLAWTITIKEDLDP